MSLLDAILGRVTEVKSAKDGVDLKIHVSRSFMPDDVITWKDMYVIVRDQWKADRPKTPIEEEAEREKPDAEHFEGINPPPSDEIEQGEIVFVAPEDSAALDAQEEPPEPSDPPGPKEEILCAECCRDEGIDPANLESAGRKFCGQCGNRRLCYSVITQDAPTPDEGGDDDDIPT